MGTNIGYQSHMQTHLGMGGGFDEHGCINSIAFKRWTVSKAAAYTVLPEDSGAVFIATAAMTFTLPAVDKGAGCQWTFINSANAAMAITAPSGTLVADGNAGATTATIGTTAHMIGGSLTIIGDGTKYYLLQSGVLLAAPTIS
jgi:hypothetical protein